MSLQVWLPLNGDYNNQGLCGVTYASSYSPTYAEGKIGQCMNGSVTVSMSTPCKLKSTKYTLSMWVKSNATNTTSSVWWKVAQIAYKDGTINTLYLASEGRYKIEYNPELNVYCDSTVWNHITYVVDGTKIYGYVNGSLYGSATCNNPERLISSFNVGGSANVYINDVRLYDHCLSIKEIKEISKGLMLHYPLRDSYIEATTNITPPPVVTSTSYDPGWDVSKHPDALSVSNWSLGYNGGVSNPTTGYHAYWKYVEGQPTMVFPNRNSEISYKNRWLGICTSGISVQNYIGASTIYTISFDARSDVDGMYINAGYYYRLTGASSSSFHDDYLKVYTTTSWKRYSATFTTKSTLDTSVGTAIYVYGGNGSVEGTAYVRNVQVEVKDHATGYTPSSRTNLVVHDCSGYGNDGTVTGSLPVVDGSGRGRYATHITDGRYNYIKSNPITLPTETVTMSCWIKGTVAGYSNYHIPLCMESGKYEMSLQGETGLFRSGFYINGTRQCITTSHDSILDGEWHMIATTYDGTTIRRYVDGVEYASTSAAGSLAGGTGYLYVGNYNGTQYGNQELTMSDVRIYATALSADDIAELYNVPIQMHKSGTVYAIEFEEG